MKKQKILLFVLVSLCSASLLGCARTKYALPSAGEYQRQVVKNYIINQKLSVNVGEAIVKRQDFMVKEVERSIVQASNDFTCKTILQTPIPQWTNSEGSLGDTFKVMARPIIKGKTYMTVDLNSGGDYDWLMIDPETGLVVDKGLGCRYKVNPPDTRFNVFKEMVVDSRSKYENWELVYTGKSGNTLNILYREYTADDLARPAFSQNLSYDLENSAFVQFKKTRIKVFEANNSSIAFEVVADDS
ncbi:hypothetical protein OAG11_03685 [Verrucomicrobia bacterium]|nr:hypothetical protein [Verrucomicrobiota bacterium]